MDYRRLGKSGLKVSEFSFGAWVTFGKQVGEDAAASIMGTAYDHGINFFDNAEGYEAGNAELVMGEALKQLKWPRESYAISSKVFWGTGKGVMDRGLSIKHVTDAAHAALKRFGTDYLDLYFCHRPDLDTPIEETVRAMTNLITQGKVLYWGTSEWPAHAIREAHKVARAHNLVAPTMEQPQYNLFHRERVELEYAPLYSEYGLGLTIWSPLASGLLTGKYNAGVPQDSRLGHERFAWLRDALLEDPQARRIERARKFTAIAEELGVPPAPLAVAWCLRNPHVSTVMLGATKKEQLVQNLEALELTERFDDATWSRIEAATA